MTGVRHSTRKYLTEPDVSLNYKSPEPGDVQGHWGLYTANKQPKWGIGAPSPVPLPSSLILLGSGLMGALGLVGNKKAKAFLTLP